MHLLVCYLNKLQNARFNDKDEKLCISLAITFEVEFHSTNQKLRNWAQSMPLTMNMLTRCDQQREI